jgi:Protein of unknown function (DUF2914)
MKTKVLLVIGIFLFALSGAGLALAQQPPQQPPQPPQEPPQQQPVQAQPVAQVNLTVEEAVMCTGVTDRTPQGVPSLTAPATAAGTTTPAAAATPQAATAATAASTAAGSGGGEAPFPFAAGVGKLYCFTKVSGATVATTIKHIWYFGDKVVHTMELSLEGSPWRTWSNKTIPPEWTGTGKVEVQDASGTLLKTVNFIVQ